MLVHTVQVGLILLQLMVLVFESLLKYAFHIVGLLGLLFLSSKLWPVLFVCWFCFFLFFKYRQ